MMIKVRGLRKEFKVPCKPNSGLLNALRFFFNPTYKKVEAVKDVDLEIRKGDIHALIGPNGAGKSTIIKILSGVLHPTRGDVEVMGYIPWKDRVRYVKRIGVLFGQKNQLWWEPPALDTYYLYREIYKIPRERFASNLAFLIRTFEIEEIVKKPVRNLSLGERMRCELVCTLLHDPELVFLDEPTIGLDLISKDTIRTLIRKINAARGTTFILTTHDMSDIANLCKNVTIINHGSVVFQDSFVQLKKYFSDRKVIELDFSRTPSQAEVSRFNLKMCDTLQGEIVVDFNQGSFRNQLKGIVSHLPVKDINIATVDVESIIKTIYQTQSAGMTLAEEALIR